MGDAAPPEPYPVAVELLGTAPRQPADSAPLVAAVAAALDACSELGRALACYVHLDGLSLSQAARRLGIGVYRARNELALADLAIAGELRRAGWDERSWAEAI
jgi:DNA-directed RNA polymerase specialized sigma24 family protein